MTRPLLSAGAILFLLLLSSCSLHSGIVTGSHPGEGAVTVRATFREIPLAGVRVEFRRSPGESAETPVASGMTNGDGIASFGIPTGKYFLVARWAKDADFSRPVAPGDRYAWFGGNPVYMQPGPPREIFLGLEEFPEPPATVGEPAGGTGVAGRVLSGGAPVEGASVFAYVRTEAAFRDLGFAASAPTGADGSFVIDLPPGSYYLITRKRASGGIAGPMRKGDLFGYYPGNPVSVRLGGYRLLSVPATALKLRNVPSYSGKYKGAALLEGRIVGPDGKPRAGVYAALYDNPDLLNRPVFLSDVTGADGRFRLPVPVPGTYFLGARSGYGGAPGPGDLYGRYEGNAAHSVTFREGDHLTGIDVTVNEVW
ncbi:MAG: carboxypeptidase-like regulatory domain-containing protein [bacterium]|nr:carboxypeptidase-like regulatory domain-containing protein [bacterium]